MPIAGELNRDWYVTNYVDGRERSGLDDYQCGIKSYAGHRGTDLVLPDFARMDAGLNVVAAAPGTVIATHDGEYDRHKAWQDTVGWNAVAVDHGDHEGHRYLAYYGHLRAGSVAVEQGQSVSAGTVLGQVGSSGRSDMPHLHFEVLRVPSGGGAAEAVDPWEGPCGAASSLWLDQIPYQDRFRVIQTGLTGDSMSLDRAKDPPAPVTDVVGGGEGTVGAWVQLHNQDLGGSVTWRWRRPDGGSFGVYTHTFETFYSMSWWWTTLPLTALDEPGTWSVQIETHEGLAASMSFNVTAAGAVRAAPDAIMRAGGGGIR